MKTYGYTGDFIDWELDGAQGWAESNWARENEASVWGDRLEKQTPGYVKQEYNKLMKEYHDGRPK